MLPSFAATRSRPWAVRIVAIAAAVVLVSVSARLTIELGTPVPFTLQPLAVLLVALLLGGRDAATSLFTYVGLIALGAPLDARGLGTAALFGPTGGFLVGFIVAAGLVGWLAERRGMSSVLRLLAALLGVAVIYLFGASFLMLVGNLSLAKAWQVGVLPFVGWDMLKAVVAVGLVEGMRRIGTRWL